MPISKASLSAKIVAAARSELGAPAGEEALQKMADVIADAVVKEIQQNLTAVVVSGLTGKDGANVTGTISAGSFR